jgi:hypothetical protein
VDNASGVAVLLEAIRTMQASGYQPARTFLFVAYSGEGFEGGEAATPEIAKFLQTKFGFSETFEIEAIVELRGLGGDSGDELFLNAGGSLHLVNLFEETASQMGVRTHKVDDPVDISVVFDERSAFDSGQEAPYIALNWEGWEEQSQILFDSPDSVSPKNLEELGRAISLALMVIGREIQY